MGNGELGGEQGKGCQGVAEGIVLDQMALERWGNLQVAGIPLLGGMVPPVAELLVIVETHRVGANGSNVVHLMLQSVVGRVGLTTHTGLHLRDYGCVGFPIAEAVGIVLDPRVLVLVPED